MDLREQFSTTVAGRPMLDVGLFTWDIGNDLIYADSALALLFGLDPALTQRGLPIETYLDRVHPSDRPQLAKQITDAIIAEHPTEQRYRVLDASDVYRYVRAVGRCFRNDADVPVHYAGIVFPDTDTQ
ncbi:PAS domain-containing protein [Rhizobium sp. Rhizsp42]|uniref:PAS domain-containing protein n=1 Tax=Rhizobium sp. Rhizsp42 TaxID=3243034 RepID=UPI0039AFE5C2